MNVIMMEGNNIELITKSCDNSDLKILVVSPASYMEFVEIIKDPRFRMIDVMIFVDYDNMPKDQDKPLRLLKWLRTSRKYTPKTVFVFNEGV